MDVDSRQERQLYGELEELRTTPKTERYARAYSASHRTRLNAALERAAAR